MERELATLRRANQDVINKCQPTLQRVRRADVYRIAEDMEEAPAPDGVACKYYVMHELKFVDAVRSLQLERANRTLSSGM
eukprot:CAMPEP_0178454452 /NCGR_PEP_ID=MMETSP0689_2-20121128/45366_1 /TAXON_ID=160604 /ORGANISM="Amphidinium massartii, Strain CS-259" /LENGTH=79 /DNA_ID=CAMNT_0020080387 /DNA_START=42 /DNA_END=281 /DNA_ORIENTATION=-